MTSNSNSVASGLPYIMAAWNSLIGGAEASAGFFLSSGSGCAGVHRSVAPHGSAVGGRDGSTFTSMVWYLPSYFEGGGT